MVGYVAEMRRLVGHRPLLLAAAGVIVQDRSGAMLLQRRTDDGLWAIPGGSVELGESLEDAARRELLEETALVARELSLLDVYSGRKFFIEYPNGDQVYVVGATFLARGLDAQAADPDRLEAAELRYFAPSALPSEMSVYTRSLIERCRYALC